MTSYEDALEAARLALSRVDAARVAEAFPAPDTMANDLPALIAAEDLLTRARALVALSRVAPETAAPLARQAFIALRDKAHAARLAYLRYAGAPLVERVVREYTQGTGAPFIAVTHRALPPDYHIERVRLKRDAPTLDAVIAFFLDRRGRWVDLGLGTLMSAVARAHPDQAGDADFVAANARVRQLEAGLDASEMAVREQVGRALIASAYTLPLDEYLALVLDGHVMHIDVTTFAARPELAFPETCLRALETLRTHPGGHNDAEAFLVTRLGELRHEPAAVLIALCALRTPATWDHYWAALLAIGGTVARDAIVRSMRRAVAEKAFPWDAEHSAANLRRAARTLLELDLDDPYELFAPFFTPAAVSTGFGAMLAREILSSLHGRFLGKGHAVTHLLDPRHAASPVLSHDARWVELLVSLASHPRLGSIAETLLETAEPALANAAIDRALSVARARVVAAPPLPARRDYLARYLAGRHDEVWSELRALGVSAADPGVADEVRAIAEEAMRRVRTNIETLLGVLRKGKVPLKPKSKALVSPKPKLLIELERYESDRRLTLPATLRALYVLVGAVDFTPTVEWPAGDPADSPIDGEPLVILPLQFVKLPRGHLKRAFPPLLRARESLRLGHSPDGRYATERVLHVAVDQPLADPPLFGLTEETLIAYLRRSLSSAGFTNGARPAPAAWTRDLLPF